MMRSDQHKASTSTSWASASTHGRAGQPSEPNQAPMTPEKPTLRAGILCQSVACATSEWLSSLAKFRPELEQLLRSCPCRKPTIVCLPDAECSGRKQSSSCTCAGKSDESFGVGRDGIYGSAHGVTSGLGYMSLAALRLMARPLPCPGMWVGIDPAVQKSWQVVEPWMGTPYKCAGMSGQLKQAQRCLLQTCLISHDMPVRFGCKLPGAGDSSGEPQQFYRLWAVGSEAA